MTYLRFFMIVFKNKNDKLNRLNEMRLLAFSLQLSDYYIGRENLNLEISFEELAFHSYAMVGFDSKNETFCISINNRILDYFFLALQAVSHEFIHIKQRLDGRLTQPMKHLPHILCWQDSPNSKPEFYQNVDSIENNEVYLNLPWEKEAFAEMDNLCCEIQSQFTDKQLKFGLFKIYDYFFNQNDKILNRLKKDYNITLKEYLSLYSLND